MFSDILLPVEEKFNMPLPNLSLTGVTLFSSNSCGGLFLTLFKLSIGFNKSKGENLSNFLNSMCLGMVRFSAWLKSNLRGLISEHSLLPILFQAEWYLGLFFIPKLKSEKRPPSLKGLVAYSLRWTLLILFLFIYLFFILI